MLRSPSGEGMSSASSSGGGGGGSSPRRKHNRVNGRSSVKNGGEAGPLTKTETSGGMSHSRHSNRRMYDPRRWHRRSSKRSGGREHAKSEKSESSNSGHPPAGWVLVWAGRFKRWRRHWFVAHPPGLLLYYKNSDQIGRPGCIKLLGATVTPVGGKERQLKIIIGAMVYYLRTISKENRQAWIDTIHQSIRTYNESLQKAASGSESKQSFQSLKPISATLLRDKCREQETEVNSRLSQRMKEIDPDSQAFLQQLQSLQKSLTVISGALGFSGQSEFPQVESLPNISHQGHAGNDIVSERNAPGSSSPLVSLGDRFPPRDMPPPSQTKSRKKLESGYQSLSMENSRVSVEHRTTLLTRGSFLLPPSDIPLAEDALYRSEYRLLDEQQSCLGRDIFRRRKSTSNTPTPSEDGHSCDPEPANIIHPIRSPSNQSIKDLSSNDQQGVTNISYESVPVSDVKSGQSSTKTIATEDSRFAPPQEGSVSVVTSESSISQPTIQVPLHAAWRSMQDAFAKVLRDEIDRVVELEAENAILLQSLSLLPQLQKDQRELIELRKKVQRGDFSGFGENRLTRQLNGDVSDGEGSDDDICPVHSEITDEDYFEALEVLNQHDFIAKSTLLNDLEALGERDDGSQEPPEEGDYSVENLSEAEGDEYDQPRTRLPAPRPLSRGFSLWTVLKNAIGKDLNHITMPATINEPLSVLQRCAEEMQFRHLLEKASQATDSIERLLWISVYACATYFGSLHRDAKPFNPLLGETYEWQAPDGKARFVAEQVSHHPPILAFHAESTLGEYCVYGEVEVKNKFWGKSVEVVPAGVVHLRIPMFADHFTWSKVKTCIHNVVVGKLWLDNYGEMTIKNHSTGDISQIKILKASNSVQGQVVGKIFDKAGLLKCSISGNYMNEILVSTEASWNGNEVYGPSKCLWKIPEPPEDYEQQYCFSRFTIGLNELTPRLVDALPPTDSRFRPDQRALEDGDLEKATQEKFRLEEKQRETQKRHKENGRHPNTMWFQQRVPGVSQVRSFDDGDEEPAWVYNGKYWNAREVLNWQNCPDIM